MRARWLLLSLLACGEVEPSVAPAEDLRVGAVESLDLGAISCGESGTSTFTLASRFKEPTRFHVNIAPPGAFVVSPLEGTLPPGDFARVEITGRPLVGTSRPREAVTAVVSVYIEGPHAHEVAIPVRFTARGAWLEAPATVDFGAVPFAAPSASAALQLKNSGDLPAHVSLGLSDAPGFSLGASELEVAPGSAVEAPISLRAPKDGVFGGTLAIAARGPLCNAGPTLVALRATVTPGTLGASPTTLDFGDSNCGVTPEAKPVLLKNYGQTPIEWTAELDASASAVFSVPATNTPMTLAPGATTALQVYPVATDVTPGVKGGVLRISTKEGGVDVALTRTKRGAALALTSPSSLGVGRVNVGTDGAMNLPFANTGNVPVMVTPKVTPADEFRFPTAPFTVPAGGTFALSGAFGPKALALRGATLSFETSGTMCTPLTDMQLQGYGFARGTRTFGRCVLLEDRQVTSPYGVALAGPVPANASFFTHSLGGQCCYRVPPSTEPICVAPATPAPRFEATPEFDGLRDVSVFRQFAVTDGGQVVTLPSRTPISNITDALRVGVAQSEVCVLRATGKVACWGEGSVIRGTQKPGPFTPVPPTSPLEFAGITGATDLAFMQSDAMLTVIHDGGKVAQLSYFGVDALPSPTDAQTVWAHDGSGDAVVLTKQGVPWINGWTALPYTGALGALAGSTPFILLADGRLLNANSSAFVPGLE